MMVDVAISAKLNNIQETNILVSSINKDENKKEKFDQLDDEMVYVIDEEVKNKLDNSQIKRHWVRFFLYELNYLNKSIISV